MLHAVCHTTICREYQCKSRTLCIRQTFQRAHHVMFVHGAVTAHATTNGWWKASESHNGNRVQQVVGEWYAQQWRQARRAGKSRAKGRR